MNIRVPAPTVFFALAILAGCSSAGDSTDVGKGELGGGTAPSGASGASGPVVVGGIESDKLTSGTCPFSPAPAILDHAICVCDDLVLGGGLETRATAGGSADVGVNGAFTAATETHIAGALVARAGVGVAGEVTTTGDLATQGDVHGAGRLAVGRDLSSGGDVGLAGELTIGGALRLGGTLMTAGAPITAARAPFQPVAEPCGCDGSKFFDVGARVKAAKAQNDNAKLGLSTDVLSVGESALTLTTGNYYFERLTTVGSYKLRVEGAVAIHVDGDVLAAGEQAFDLAPGATLDLFVNGNMQSAGDLRLGEGASAGSFRLYVAGDQVVHAGAQAFHGMLYAPRATVAFAGGTVVHGAVFAKSLVYAGSLLVDYQSAVAPAPTVCQPEPPASGGGSGNEPTSSDAPPSPK
jgi:hypothetical protein